MKVLVIVILSLTFANASNLHLNESGIVPKGRILNGQDADPKQFPYIVGLEVTRSNSELIWCGGTLIKENWILTAAHCLRDVFQVDVVFGASNRRNYDKILTVMAKDIIVHENYNDVIRLDDIGLIKIPSVDFTDYIQPIELPDKENSDYAGKKVLIAGWGVTTYKNNIVDKLQWGRMEVTSNNECANIDKVLLLCARIYTKAIDGAQILMGDSGGPLVLESTPNIVIGVAVLGSEPGQGREEIRGVFTNVQAYLGWINKNINKNINRKINKTINKNMNKTINKKINKT